MHGMGEEEQGRGFQSQQAYSGQGQQYGYQQPQDYIRETASSVLSLSINERVPYPSKAISCRVSLDDRLLPTDAVLRSTF